MRIATRVVLLALTACGGTQKLTVITEPPGATVTLTKIGIRTVTADYAARRGYDSRVHAGRYEDPPIVLGLSPIEYEFPLEEKEPSAELSAYDGSATKQVKEGVIRAEKGGFKAERRVTFDGTPLRVELKLER